MLSLFDSFHVPYAAVVKKSRAVALGVELRRLTTTLSSIEGFSIVALSISGAEPFDDPLSVPPLTALGAMSWVGLQPPKSPSASKFQAWESPVGKPGGGEGMD